MEYLLLCNRKSWKGEIIKHSITAYTTVIVNNIEPAISPVWLIIEQPDLDL